VPEGIAETVGDKAEESMDGGIRSGQDVLKALSGRSFLYG
jgi:isopentenyl diphosphate isomerase/L-lactate dehydrogenase-like FMN-dependent dehydrogenase